MTSLINPRLGELVPPLFYVFDYFYSFRLAHISKNSRCVRSGQVCKNFCIFIFGVSARLCVAERACKCELFCKKFSYFLLFSTC